MNEVMPKTVTLFADVTGADHWLSGDQRTNRMTSLKPIAVFEQIWSSKDAPHLKADASDKVTPPAPSLADEIKWLRRELERVRAIGEEYATKCDRLEAENVKLRKQSQTLTRERDEARKETDDYKKRGAAHIRMLAVNNDELRAIIAQTDERKAETE